jgi:hypothetical protein
MWPVGLAGCALTHRAGRPWREMPPPSASELGENLDHALAAWSAR